MSLDSIQVGEYFFEKFISKEKINSIVQRMASEIDDYYKKIDPLEFIIILDGAYHFASDFTRAFPRDVKLHFVKIKSYEGFQSSGKASIQGLEQLDIKDKHILILEDIVETGNTLYHLTQELKLKAAASVRLASLFVKPTEIIQPLQVDFFGMEIGPEFIIGYGLDYNGFGRTYADIYIKK